MSDRTATFRRDVLFEEVWAEPMVAVAPRYGLSGPALAKICLRLGVPIPRRGHWARTRNRKIKRDRERRPEALITVPDVLEQPHPLVKASAATLRHVSSGRRQLRAEKSCLDIDVSAAQLDRAIRIMDALLKAFEVRGFNVVLLPTPLPDDPPRVAAKRIHVPVIARTTVVIGQKQLTLRLVEAYDFVALPAPTRTAELESWNVRRALGPTPTERRFNGQLVIELDFGSYGSNRRWRDSSGRKLEDCLNAVVAGAVGIAERDRLAGIARALSTRNWERDKRRQELAERRRQREADRLEELRERLAAWTEARTMRELAAAAEAAEAARTGSVEADSPVAEWLEWVRAQAERRQQAAFKGSRAEPAEAED